ncbi:putative acetyltransferase [Inquilinus ginsengisoli]|uniref:Acetyltransferase n=1 Tax=Inquilinus ginsengisoli TaxID=363840 RepID=A0ABU1JZB0_9PROT|nr:acetyltransferase [Inquilinus ginsengisoli]MDR6293960.1 putative acetyltransferase [Inquilinus ginsengisoli]
MTVAIRAGRLDDNPELLDIWLRAVRATHHFLTEDDIQVFVPLLRDHYLAMAELWVAAGAGDAPVGFMGLAEAKVEMLFVDPDRHGLGTGRALLAHAAALKGALTLDVNEQNPGAVAFYRRCGFRETGRSPVDGMGMAFPLIHMAAEA